MKNYSNSLLLLLIIFFTGCHFFEKKQIEPFSQFNVRLKQDMSNPWNSWDTLGKEINELIYSKIELTPDFDSLPFGLKIGDNDSNIVEKLKSNGILFNSKNNNQNEMEIIICSSIISINKNMYSGEICDSFPVKSKLKIIDHKLIEINQEIGVPACFFTHDLNPLMRRNNNNDPEWEKLNSKNYLTNEYPTIISIIADEFLKIYKTKYGEENYNIEQKRQVFDVIKNNGSVPNYFINRYLWLKRGVLINLYILHQQAETIYNKYKLYNDKNLSDIYIINIGYSSVKRFWDQIIPLDSLKVEVPNDPLDSLLLDVEKQKNSDNINKRGL